MTLSKNTRRVVPSDTQTRWRRERARWEECLLLKSVKSKGAGGWGCCRCKTYNAAARTRCRKCEHVVCRRKEPDA